MKTYTMPARELAYDDSWDVIVAGGGPAGCAAAIAAAREGAKTLLLEATGCLGGMGTSGLVPAWCPFSDGEKMVYQGIAAKVFEASKEGVPHVRKEDTDWAPINAERLKRVYDDMVVQSGARILFHTMLSGVQTDGEGRVTALIVSNKQGLSAYSAKAYVDATGDGDLAVWADAAYEQGDGSGDVQPATHCFALGNVDVYAYLYGPMLHANNPDSPIYDIVRSGDYPDIPDVHMCNNLVGPGMVGFNAGHLWNVDNTDPFSVSDAMIKGRRMAESFHDALVKYHPAAFAGSFLAATAPLMGVRESRRIVGDYTLTADDYFARRSFPDEIGRNCYYLDMHHPAHEAQDVVDGKIDLAKRGAAYGKGESHGIPYRCLTPKSLRNVLVAGRTISTDRAMQASVRVMPPCLVVGEAAGLAAALSLAMADVDVHQVDVGQLRSRLKEEGAYFL